MIIKRLMIQICLWMTITMISQAETFDWNLSKGWNLVNVPLNLNDESAVNILVPHGIDGAWEWDGTRYTKAISLKAGRGYWIYLTVDEKILTLSGTPVDNSTIQVDIGWNLIGACGPVTTTMALPLKTLDTGTDLSCWLWNGSNYEKNSSTTPGQGFWVHSSAQRSLLSQGAPMFSGITMAYSPDAGQLKLRWTPAIDDKTDESQILYNVYLKSTSAPGDLFDSVNTTLSNLADSSHLFESLTVDEYDVAVVAVDEDGNRSGDGSFSTIKVSDTSLTLNRAVHDISAETFAYDEQSDSVMLSSGTPVAVDEMMIIPERIPQLCKVLSVDGDSLPQVITLTRGTLDDAIASGGWEIEAAFPDFSYTEADEPSPTRGFTPQEYSFSGGGINSLSTTRSTTPLVVLKKGMLWVDLSGNTPGDGEDVEAGVKVSFKPKTAARIGSVRGFDGSVIDDGVKILAKGTFRLDMKFIAKINASLLEIKPTEPIKLNKIPYKIDLNYSIGALPVKQEVGIDFYMDYSVNVNASMEVTQEFWAEKEVLLGFTWDRDTNSFDFMQQSGFERGMTFNVALKGGGTATITVYPQVYTTFYKAATFAGYIKPSINLEVEATAKLLPAPYSELTKMNANFKVDAGIEANLEVFSVNLLSWESDPWNLLTVGLFSLPEIESNPLVVEPYIYKAYLYEKTDFAVKVTDGINNLANNDFLEAWVTPDADAQYALISYQNGTVAVPPQTTVDIPQVTFTRAGTYQLWCSVYGDSFLKELGERYLIRAVEVVDISQLVITADSLPDQLQQGESYQPTLSVTYTDGATKIISDGFEFEPLDAAFATSSGTTLTVKQDAPLKAFDVSVKLGSQTVTKRVTVLPQGKTVTALQCTNQSLTVGPGESLQLTFMATFDDASTTSVIASLTTSNSDIEINGDTLTVSATASMGPTQVTAEYGGQSINVPINIYKPTLEVSLTASSYSQGELVAFTAQLLNGDGSYTDVTSSVTFTSYDSTLFEVLNDILYVKTGVPGADSAVTFVYGEISCEQEITINDSLIPDPVLAKAIRQIVGTNITMTNLAQVTELSVVSEFTEDGYKINEVYTIAGLNYCTNLQVLVLNDHSITDYAPIFSLNKLRDIELQFAMITDEDLLELPYPLATLFPNLQRLDLTGNQIDDVSFVSGLNNLQELDLTYCYTGNQIANLHLLAALPALRTLYLEGDQLASLSFCENLDQVTVLILYDVTLASFDVSYLERMDNLTGVGLSFAPDHLPSESQRETIDQVFSRLQDAGVSAVVF